MSCHVRIASLTVHFEATCLLAGLANAPQIAVTCKQSDGLLMSYPLA